MNKTYLLFLLPLLISYTSCKKDDPANKNINELEGNIVSELINEEQVRNISEKFFNCFFKSENKEHVLTKNNIESIEIEPIKYNNEIVYFSVNYPTNEGYILISPDPREFPVVKYSRDGNFKLDSINESEKETLLIEFENKLIQRKNNSTSKIDVFWQYFLMDGQIVNDTTYNVEFQFVIEYGDKDEDNMLSKADYDYGFIPERENPKNYYSLRNFLELKGRKWTSQWPYNYDMPNVGYIGSSGNINKPIIPPIVVAFALVMDYYGIPRTINWDTFPDNQTEKRSTALTKFLAELAVDLGYDKSYNYPGIKTSVLFNEIPNNLPKYNFNADNFKEFTFDESIFAEIYNSIFHLNPVIYVYNITDEMNNRFLLNCAIIDGVQEVYVHYIIRTSVAGFVVRKTHKYVYEDFFHFHSPHTEDGSYWAKYNNKFQPDSYGRVLNHYVYLYPYKLWYL
ncbi:MAG: Spi family protease inhibitor [Rikenellaceae bacterium]|nr:Spi family protease inhibitor [Rikenellaceae bacterium]